MMPCESHPLGLDPPDVILYILEALFHIIETQGSLTPRSPNYITSCSARCTVYYLLILVNLNALIHKRDKTSIYILLCTHTHTTNVFIKGTIGMDLFWRRRGNIDFAVRHKSPSSVLKNNKWISGGSGENLHFH